MLFDEKGSPKGTSCGSKIDKHGVQKLTFPGYLKKWEKGMLFEGADVSKVLYIQAKTIVPPSFPLDLVLASKMLQKLDPRASQN